MHTLCIVAPGLCLAAARASAHAALHRLLPRGAPGSESTSGEDALCSVFDRMCALSSSSQGRRQRGGKAAAAAAEGAAQAEANGHAPDAGGEGGSENGSAAAAGGQQPTGARLLVDSSQIGYLVGKGGSTIKNTCAQSGAAIKILPKAELPPCACVTDEIVQVGWLGARRGVRRERGAGQRCAAALGGGKAACNCGPACRLLAAALGAAQRGQRVRAVGPRVVAAQLPALFNALQAAVCCRSSFSSRLSTPPATALSAPPPPGLGRPAAGWGSAAPAWRAAAAAPTARAARRRGAAAPRARLAPRPQPVPRRVRRGGVGDAPCAAALRPPAAGGGDVPPPGARGQDWQHHRPQRRAHQADTHGDWRAHQGEAAAQ